MPQDNNQQPGLLQNFLNFIMGRSALGAASGPTGTPAAPTGPMITPDAIRARPGNPVLSKIGEALTGTKDPNHQNPAYLQGAVDRYMEEQKQAQAKAAGKHITHPRGTTPSPVGKPTSQISNPASPFIDLFHSVLGKLGHGPGSEA